MRWDASLPWFFSFKSGVLTEHWVFGGEGGGSSCCYSNVCEFPPACCLTTAGARALFAVLKASRGARTVEVSARVERDEEEDAVCGGLFTRLETSTVTQVRPGFMLTYLVTCLIDQYLTTLWNLMISGRLVKICFLQICGYWHKWWRIISNFIAKVFGRLHFYVFATNFIHQYLITSEILYYFRGRLIIGLADYWIWYKAFFLLSVCGIFLFFLSDQQ